MKRNARGNFSFAFNGSDGVTYDIFGTWYVLTKDQVDMHPLIDQIRVHYFVFESTEGGAAFKPLPRSRYVSIIESDGEWRIGEIVNQSFKEAKGKFTGHLRDYIVGAYRDSVEAPIPDDQAEEL